MDTLRSLLDIGLVKWDTLVTVHVPIKIGAQKMEKKLCGRFYDDAVLRYLPRYYHRVEVDRIQDFCEVYLTEVDE